MEVGGSRDECRRQRRGHSPSLALGSGRYSWIADDMKSLTLGFFPCPNDTFVFDALVHGRFPPE
jgi:hypothetical protein